MGKRHFYGKADGLKAKHDDNSSDDRNESTTKAEELLKMEGSKGKNKRREQLREQLRKQYKTRLSTQKKKRLNKYIEHQLKREEKEILLKKLQQTQIDTSILKSAKLIGTGRQTKREKLTEALELEKEGKGTDATHDLLYEPRKVKTWEDTDFNYDDGRSQIAEHSKIKNKSVLQVTPDETGNTNQSFGFSFSNLTKVKKASKKRKYTWRAEIEAEEAKRRKHEDDDDFQSSSSDDDYDDDNNNNDNNGVDGSLNGDDRVNDGESSSSENTDVISEEPKQRFHGVHTKAGQDFKKWAEQRAKHSEGITEIKLQPTPKNYKPLVRPEDLEDDREEEFISLNENLNRKIFTVEVDRSEEIQAVRTQLPVYGEEYKIMDAIHNNDCIIICGETGSGKTTQVPQFLFESGYGSKGSDTPGMIGITEPRRVAAVSMANRVSKELCNYGNKVAYQIRFDGNVKKDTALKFMTDGVLLREMMSDFMLNKYSAIIIDEAHERSVNTDILIGMLSRILKLRRQYYQQNSSKWKPLKLIIMSATLRVKDFSGNRVLFKESPPVLKVDARQYPVSIHFNKRTAFNYTEEVFRKTCKIHRRLPKGAILIFLTGKAEINDMVRRLRKEFPFPENKKKYFHVKNNEDDILEVGVSSKNVAVEQEDIDLGIGKNIQDVKDDYDANEEEENEEGFEETLEEDQTPDDPLYVLPLYSQLPTKEQMKIFSTPPKGSRLCVVATNVAETSLTIPGVRYVVDSGRAKERKYDEKTGVQSFEVNWISKASADQRSGRAGRTGPGHCYRIYSSALFESDFPQFSTPEILRMPVESVVLTMKSMGIDNIINFPFPTSPSRTMMDRAEKLLGYLGALDTKKQITEFGRQMSLLPVSPRFSKMLLIGNQQECLPYIIAVVAGLSVGDPFLNEYDLGIKINESGRENDNSVEDDNKSDDHHSQNETQITQLQQEKKRQLLSRFNKSRKIFGHLDKYGDSIKLLFAICSVDYVKEQNRDHYYDQNFLNSKIMNDIRKLRKQLTYIVDVNLSKDSVASSHVTDEGLKLPKPSKVQIQSIKQMITAAFIDQIVVRADIIEKDVKIGSNTKIINIPYVTLFPSTDPEVVKNYEGSDDKEYVYIHPSSIISQSGDLPPKYLVFEALQLSSNATSSGFRKVRIKPLNDVTGKALANVGKNSGLVTYSKPLGNPYGPRNITPTERVCYVVPRFGANIGNRSLGWNLPAIKVKQKKVHGSWIIE